MNEFELTAIVYQEVQPKVDVEPLEKLLNSKLRLADYGSSVKKIFFVFIAVPPEDSSYEAKVMYHKDTSTLEIGSKLSYPSVLNSTDGDVQQMMRVLFIQSFEGLTELSTQGFNVRSFLGDLSKILS